MRLRRRIKRGIVLKAPWEIELLRTANRIVAEVLTELCEKMAPGMTTLDLNLLAREGIEARGGKAAFEGYRGYPAALCVSVNSEVVHGIPSADRTLEAGDLVSLDIGVIYEGYYGDAAVSAVIGEPTAEQERLLKITEESLYKGIDKARPKGRLSDISHAIQAHVERAGFSVVRQFVGHGIGKALHEPPEIPNYGPPGQGPVLKPGMVLAIEPMVNAGGPEVKVLPDGWTAVTLDGSLSAHFEHSVVVTKSGPEILSRA